MAAKWRLTKKDERVISIEVDKASQEWEEQGISGETLEERCADLRFRLKRKCQSENKKKRRTEARSSQRDRGVGVVGA